MLRYFIMCCSIFVYSIPIFFQLCYNLFYLLFIGKKLGIGAFGIVFKGEARNIIKNESVTTVAVKMARNNVEAGKMQALVDELKIMLHVGEHLNIVNLLGACTKTIIDGNYSFPLPQ